MELVLSTWESPRHGLDDACFVGIRHYEGNQLGCVSGLVYLCDLLNLLIESYLRAWRFSLKFERQVEHLVLSHAHHSD